jgi:hypothetical protein
MNRKDREIEELCSVICMFETTHLHRPEETRKLLNRVGENVDILCNAFDEHEHAGQLVSVLHQLADDLKALAHYKGLYQGVTLAQRPAKVPKRKKAAYQDEIVSIIFQHPDWTARQIYTELDRRKVRLVHLGRTLLAENTKWVHVADEDSYKVLITRLRTYVQDLYQVKGLKRLIKIHNDLRGE